MASSQNMAAETRRMKRIIAPLTRREERAAIKAVLALFDRGGTQPARPPRLLGVELRIEKPARSTLLPQRRIRVVVADYANRRVVDVAVDQRFRVVEETHYRGVQPAFSDAEIAEGRSVADGDARVARAISRRRIFVESFSPPTSDRRGSRTIGLRYVLERAKRGVDVLAEAIVNLDSLTVIAVAARHTQPDGGAHGTVR